MEKCGIILVFGRFLCFFLPDFFSFSSLFLRPLFGSSRKTGEEKREEKEEGKKEKKTLEVHPERGTPIVIPDDHTGSPDHTYSTGNVSPIVRGPQEPLGLPLGAVGRG